MTKAHVIEIEDVAEAFNGCRRKNMVSLSDKEPEMAAEWCFEKNCGWGPDQFSHASTTKVWWECPFCLRTYKTKINCRTAQGSGCPFCASKLVCEDNSLIDHFPELVKEWHPKKNGKNKPEDFTRFSGKRAWWLCSQCEHQWQTTISDRTLSQAGCPACYEADIEDRRENPKPRVRKPVVLNNLGKPVSRAWYEAGRIKFKPLSKTHPKLAKQWHPVKNGKYTADDFPHGSEALVWWRCTKDRTHEWQSQIMSRSRSPKVLCQFCKEHLVNEHNNLAKKNPKLAKEWHPKKNGKLKPSEVTARSNKKVWWRCKVNPAHEWETRISLRARGRSCHFCSHQKITAETSIATNYPYIAAQLHTTKNNGIKAESLAPNSAKKSGGSALKAKTMFGRRAYQIESQEAPGALIAQVNR